MEDTQLSTFNNPTTKIKQKQKKGGDDMQLETIPYQPRPETSSEGVGAASTEYK